MFANLLSSNKGQNQIDASVKKIFSVKVQRTDSDCPLPCCACKDGKIESCCSIDEGTISCFVDCRNSKDRNELAKADRLLGKKDGDWFDNLTSDLPTIHGRDGTSSERNRRNMALKNQGDYGRVRPLKYETQFENCSDNDNYRRIYRENCLRNENGETLITDYNPTVCLIDKNSPVDWMCQCQNDTLTDMCSLSITRDHKSVKHSVDEKTEHLRSRNCEQSIKSKYQANQCEVNSRSGNRIVNSKEHKSDTAEQSNCCKECFKYATRIIDCTKCDRESKCFTSSHKQTDKPNEIRSTVNDNSTIISKEQKSNGKTEQNCCKECFNNATRIVDCVKCDRGCNCLSPCLNQADKHIEIRKMDGVCGCSLATSIMVDDKSKKKCRNRGALKESLKFSRWDELQDMDDRLRRLESVMKYRRDVEEDVDRASVDLKKQAKDDGCARKDNLETDKRVTEDSKGCQLGGNKETNGFKKCRCKCKCCRDMALNHCCNTLVISYHHTDHLTDKANPFLN